MDEDARVTAPRFPGELLQTLRDLDQALIRCVEAALAVGRVELEGPPARTPGAAGSPSNRLRRSGSASGARGSRRRSGRRRDRPRARRRSARRSSGPLGDEAAQGRDPRGDGGAARAGPGVRQPKAADDVVDVDVQVDEPGQHVAAFGLDDARAPAQAAAIADGGDLAVLDQHVAGHGLAPRIDRAAADQGFHSALRRLFGQGVDIGRDRLGDAQPRQRRFDVLQTVAGDKEDDLPVGVEPCSWPHRRGGRRHRPPRPARRRRPPGRPAAPGRP